MHRLLQRHCPSPGENAPRTPPLDATQPEQVTTPEQNDEDHSMEDAVLAMFLNGVFPLHNVLAEQCCFPLFTKVDT